MVGSMATQNIPALFKDSGGAQLLPTDSMWEFEHSVIRYYPFWSPRNFTHLKFDMK